MKVLNAVRTRHERNGDGTLGVRPAAKVVRINWTAFTEGIDKGWVLPQATIFGETKNSAQRPIYGFVPEYLDDLKPIFKGSTKGAKIWTPDRIAACQKLNKKWLGRTVKYE